MKQADPATSVASSFGPATGITCAVDPTTGVTYAVDPTTGVSYAVDPMGGVYSHDPSTGMTYAADHTTGMVYAADLLGGFYSTEQVSGATFAADASTGMLYVADATGGVYATDLTTGASYAADPSTGYVYSADTVTGTVYGADPDTGAVWQVAVMPGDRPTAAAVDAGGETVAREPKAFEPSGTSAQELLRSRLGEHPAVGSRVREEDANVSAGGMAKLAELYPHRVEKSHFYTTSLIELATKLTDQGYQNDGIAFSGFALPISGALPLVRLSHSDGRFLYTSSQVEAYAALAQKRYVFDLILCYVAPAAGPGLTSLYRLESVAHNDTLFTTLLLELQKAVDQDGYMAQGIAGRVLGTVVPGVVPVYCLSKVV